MKFVFASFGTEGDARPFAALCRGLIDAGHDAHLLADGSTLASAHSLGVPTTALAGDIRRAVDAARVAAKGGGLQVTARALARIANDNVGAWLDAILGAGEGADAVIGAGLSAFAAFSAAERLGAQAIGAGMIPITPTSAFPSPFLPPWTPRAVNRASHRFVNALLWRAFREKTNAARARRGLPARGPLWAGLPMIYGVSPALIPAPADWPADVRLCGQWLAPAPAWTSPEPLARFLAAGEAPVYVGFGSMTGFDAAPLMAAVVEALDGRRALFNPGWSGAEVDALPGHVFVIGEAPHDWLFARVAAVVHHGGAGTSHSATRARAPSIVVPFAGDQGFWAERLRLAGVAPAAVNGRRPRMQAFAKALDYVGSVPVRRRAAQLGEAMRAEDGVTAAITALERAVEGSG